MCGRGPGLERTAAFAALTSVALLLAGCGLLAGNRPPVAIARASPTRGSAPLTVQFDGSASISPEGGEIARYTWDFGDGGRARGALAVHVVG